MSEANAAVTLKDTTLALAAAIKKDLKINKDGVIEASPDLYEKHLADTGLDMATIKKIQAHTADFVSGLGLAVGELGIKAMEKDKNLEMVYCEVPIHKDRVIAQFDRTREVPDGKGGRMTQYGKLSSSYTVSGASNKGELKKVRNHLMGLAEAALKA